MHSRKTHARHPLSLRNRRSVGRPRKPLRTIEFPGKAPGRLSSLSSSQDDGSLMVVDKDLTLINQNDSDAAEWTDEQPGNDDDGDVYFHWDEEETLFSDLLDEAYASGL
jgi:hypothetical protein